MRNIVLILALSLWVTAPAFAALPPHYQRQAEFGAVIRAATEIFGIQRLVDGVELSGPDTYSVRSGDCVLTVRILDTTKEHPPGWAGPREFEARPDPLSC